MEFWKGSFLPFVKHVSRVSFVPLEEMDSEGWEVLDFPALRPMARAKIVRRIVNGNLEGFFQVDYDMHKRSHGGKPRYFFPAEDRKVDAFDAGEFDDGEFETFGGNYASEDVPEYPEFEEAYVSLADIPSERLAPYATSLYVMYQREDEEEEGRFYVTPAYAGMQGWAVALTIIALVYREKERTRLMEYAESLGIPDTGQTLTQLRRDIIEAIRDREDNEGVSED